MKPIRAIIADDEVLARSRMRQFLKLEDDIEVLAEAGNGKEAVESVRREQPDLLFLDVQMPELNGVEVCETLAGKGVPLPLVIFVTAFDRYALKAFEVHALDYLLKPFDRERFARALDHARAHLRKRDAGDADPRLAHLLEELRTGGVRPDRLVFKEDGRIVFLTPDAIDWVEADGNYLRLHAGAQSHYIRETLAAMEAQLPAARFMRVSRSTLVNLDRVREFQPLFHGDFSVVLHNGHKLTLSRNYRERLDRMLDRRR